MELYKSLSLHFPDPLERQTDQEFGILRPQSIAMVRAKWY
jgi:hypothetical protein